MELFKTLLELSNQTTKADYLLHVKSELKSLSKKLKEAGYTIGRDHKITAPKTILYEFVDEVSYFKKLRFIYNGLKFDRWPDDLDEPLLFIGLKGFVESQYNSLPE